MHVADDEVSIARLLRNPVCAEKKIIRPILLWIQLYRYNVTNTRTVYKSS